MSWVISQKEGIEGCIAELLKLNVLGGLRIAVAPRFKLALRPIRGGTSPV